MSDQDGIHERSVIYASLVKEKGWRDFLVPEVESIIASDRAKLCLKSTDWDETRRLRTRIEAMRQVLDIPEQAMRLREIQEMKE